MLLRPFPFAVVHLGLACFYAFVLPFICFGALATPGHPHARPHFVFTDPPLVGEKLPRTVPGAEWLLLNANAWLCTPSDSTPASSDTATSGANNPTSPVAGRSAPPTLALILLLFHVSQALLLVVLRPNRFVRLIGDLIPQQLEPEPPLPPPRLAITLS